MSGQLIPPAELAPPSLENLNVQQRIAAWLDLLDTTDELLLAGIRRTAKTEDEVRAAYRAWYEDYLAEHERTQLRMMEQFERSRGKRGL